MNDYAKQLIDFQKNTFETAFNTIVQIQDQTESLTSDMMGQMHWLPEESKKAMDDSVKMFKNAREDYKKMVNDGFVKMEELFIR